MIISVPWSIPAWKGIKSQFCIASRSNSEQGRWVWLSSPTLPCPGKCLSAVAMPAASRPLMKAVTYSAAVCGSSENERTPMIGLAGLLLTSETGAKSILKPSALISSPSIWAVSSARAGSPAAARAILPEPQVPKETRFTMPPSWSTQINMGIPWAEPMAAS